MHELFRKLWYSTIISRDCIPHDPLRVEYYSRVRWYMRKNLYFPLYRLSIESLKIIFCRGLKHKWYCFAIADSMFPTDDPNLFGVHYVCWRCSSPVNFVSYIRSSLGVDK